MSLPSNWPQKVKSGNVEIPIYRVDREKGGNPYTEFKVVWYGSDRKRRFKTFADFQQAKTHAGNINASINRGDIKSLTLTGDEMLIYGRAKESLHGLGCTLDHATAEYAHAMKLLDGLNFREAVQTFAATHKGVVSKTVQSVVDEFLLEKTKPNQPNKRPVSARYSTDLTCRLNRFAEAFHCNLDTIRSEQVREFLDALKVGGRTYANFARIIATFFNWAKGKKYFSKEINPLEGISTEYEDTSEIEIFSPKELAKLLAHAGPDMVPYLAIGAFAGLRQAELLRLDWSEVKPGFIEIKKSKAKTRSRRLVPIQPNLESWIAGHRKESGPVVPFREMFRPVQDLLAKTPGVKWKHNALRHSFVSYRMAITKNENLVAAEAGNSPAKIFQNYRELVSDHDAAAWFSIEPKQAANVLQMRVEG
jgi:integrase